MPRGVSGGGGSCATRVESGGSAPGREGLGLWKLLVSVDFEHHGSAPPGHWHVNVTPGGDPMPHWGPSKEHAVFHGDPRNCPLWWLLIPQHCAYKQCPARALLIEAVGGS